MWRAFVALVLCLGAAPLQAEAIRKACVTSDRGKGRQTLCACIQGVADQTLTKRDQRLVVRFFADPERAQSIRLSDSRLHEDFWERYERFGRSAEALCRR